MKLLSQKSSESLRMIHLFKKTGDEAYLHAAAVLDAGAVKDAGHQVGRGRPRDDDWEFLIEMDNMIVIKGKKVHAAAVAMAPRAGGNSIDAAVKRLSRKYKTDHSKIRSQAAFQRAAVYGLAVERAAAALSTMGAAVAAAGELPGLGLTMPASTVGAAAAAVGRVPLAVVAAETFLSRMDDHAAEMERGAARVDEVATSLVRVLARRGGRG